MSSAVDLLTTVMIAARLIYHHRKQRELAGRHSNFYLPVLTIFIESSVLSLVGKVMQILLSLYTVSPQDPFVVPLCVGPIFYFAHTGLRHR